MTAYSYGDTTTRESLWNQIKDIERNETYVTSHSGTVKVTQKVHSWNTDPMAQQTNGAGTVEGADTTYSATNPTLYSNNTQIIEKGIKVVMTSQNSDHAGFKDKFAREQAKKMREWKNNFEISATVGTLTSGTGSAARTMQGFLRYATLSTGMSGVSLTSDMFNDFLGTAWDQGSEHKITLVGRTMKARISGFTTSNTREINAEDKKVVNTISIYESDYYTTEVVLHRYVNQLAANTYNVLATYDPDFVSIGFLDEPHFEERATGGYYKAGAVVGEATVQLANPLAAQTVRGLL